ncbi:hypothetical protein V2J09_020674 [Rumex salicifolius]
MATAPIKSPLHNFPLSFLKWGSTSSVNPNHRFRRPLDSPPRDSDPNPPPDTDDHAQRQWNLRPRRFGPSEFLTKSSEFLAEPETAPKSSRLRCLAEGGSGGSANKREKQRLWVSLSKEEIEEDIYSLTGSKPSRRPRKRSKTVQKQLDFN